MAIWKFSISRSGQWIVTSKYSYFFALSQPYPGTDRNKLVSDKSSDYTAAKVYHEKLTAAKEASDHRKNVIVSVLQRESLPP